MMKFNGKLGYILCLIIAIGCEERIHNGVGIFRYNESAGIATLDPAFARNQSIMWAVHQLYNTLVETDSRLQIVPSLAKRWEYSADKKTIFFYLRDDVYFHNDACFGNRLRKLTAYDVEYSLNRLIDPLTASTGAWILQNKIVKSGLKAKDDTTFVIQLSAPFQPLLGLLSMPYCSIVPKEAVQYYKADFRRHPVGTGPFTFLAWEEGQALILRKNERYFEKDENGKALPYLNGIKVSFVDAKASEFLQFQQQQIDFINDIDASFKDELITRSGNLKKVWQNKIVLQKNPYLNIEYLGIYQDTFASFMRGSPLSKKKVRQALNYALNRKKLVFYLRNSIGTPALSGFIPKGLPGYEASYVPYEYNPAKAIELLKQSDYRGERITLYTIPQYANLASFIINEWKECGINASVEVVPKSLLLELTAKGEVAFFRGSWIADYADAENYLGVFFSKNPAPPNYTRYKNEKYDSLFEVSLLELNDSARYVNYAAMNRMIMEDAAVVPLWYDMALHLVQPTITGLEINAMNMLDLRRVKKNN